METVTKKNKRNGEILLGFRKQNKMTQWELAEVIGRDQRDISKYEKGFRAIPQNSIELLNEKYNLKLKPTGKVVRVSKKSKAVDIPITETTIPNVSFENVKWSNAAKIFDICNKFIRDITKLLR